MSDLQQIDSLAKTPDRARRALQEMSGPNGLWTMVNDVIGSEATLKDKIDAIETIANAAQTLANAAQSTANSSASTANSALSQINAVTSGSLVYNVDTNGFQPIRTQSYSYSVNDWIATGDTDFPGNIDSVISSSGIPGTRTIGQIIQFALIDIGRDRQLLRSIISDLIGKSILSGSTTS